MTQVALFPMARTSDPQTSHAAAEVIRPDLSELQSKVLAAFKRHGPMTARKAERLPEFADYGFSTIRKRISELHRAGHLKEHGTDRTRRAPATIYAEDNDG